MRRSSTSSWRASQGTPTSAATSYRFPPRRRGAELDLPIAPQQPLGEGRPEAGFDPGDAQAVGDPLVAAVDGVGAAAAFVEGVVMPVAGMVDAPRHALRV